MLVVALTGGIGAGKSTVARMLGERGALVIDADEISRQLVVPPSKALDEIAQTFGRDKIKSDGTLDRAKLASVVFADDVKLGQLNGIMHPKIGAEITARVEEVSERPGVVVIDVPLFESAPLLGIQHLAEAVVVVLSDMQLRIKHLVERGMDEQDAKARIAAQGTDEQRMEVADHVIRNDGTLQDLEAAVGTVWDKLLQQPGARPA